jgi:hypothetical protein
VVDHPLDVAAAGGPGEAVLERLRTPLLYATNYEGGACGRYVFSFNTVPNQELARLLPHMQRIAGETFYMFGADYVWPQRMFETARGIVRDWYVAQLSMLPGMIRNRAPMDLALSGRVVNVLLRDVIAAGTFGAIGLLTQAYQPHLAIYLPEDEDALRQHVRELEQLLESRGSVRSRDLSDPPRSTSNDGWRLRLLAHGEFLGRGTFGGSVLTSWEALA